MADLEVAWRAAIGQPVSRELVEARRGFGRRDVRRVRRAMRRGERLDDPAEARLAVALAREQEHQLHVNKRWQRSFLRVLVIVWLVFALGLASDGSTAVAVFFAAAAIWGMWMLAMWSRWRRNARATIENHLDVPDPLPGFADRSGGERALGSA